MYAALMSLAGPLLRRHVGRRARSGKEDPARTGERFGMPGADRPSGKVIWFHAASVGEGMAVLPLIRAVLERFGTANVLLTTHTLTSARLLGKRLPDRVIHQFLPLDRPTWIARFLDHWQPDAVIWTESEFWPCWLAAIGSRGVPAAMVNGRLSVRAAGRWRLCRKPLARMLSIFAVRLAQSEADAERLSRFAPGFHCVGNLKTAIDPQPIDEDAAQLIRLAIVERPFWLAANTHPGEETIAFDVHKALTVRHPGMLTIIVPRHPKRAAEIADLAAANGLHLVRRSTGALPGPDTDVYLADTMGELRLFYAFSPVAFIGGSFSSGIGVHSPVEAVHGRAAIVYGPYQGNNAGLTGLLEAGHGAVQARDPAALTRIVEDWLANPASARAVVDAAAAVMAAEGDIVGKVMAELQPVFDRAGLR